MYKQKVKVAGHYLSRLTHPHTPFRSKLSVTVAVRQGVLGFTEEKDK